MHSTSVDHTRAATAGAIPAGPGWRRFTRHFVEMIVAMAVGMLVLGGALELLLAFFGTGLHAGPTAVMAAVMAFDMTVPMVAWMHLHHRMPVARSIEMTAAMVVPTATAVALNWAGSIDADGVMLVQHGVMIPAMLGVMLWRREAYSH